MASLGISGLSAAILLLLLSTGISEEAPEVVKPTKNASGFPLEFLQAFKVDKSIADQARILELHVPQDYVNFKEFIARVVDTSEASDQNLRDTNRTFRITPLDPSVIRIHGLNPGHRYNIAVMGRVEDRSVSIKEESIVMDPVPVEFSSNDSILVSHHNITLRGFKVERSIQDKYSVKYFQIDPLKRYPTVTINDKESERFVEFNLHNLTPGRDYDVTMTSIRDSVVSSPWKKVITTVPLSPVDLSVTELNNTCVKVKWNLPHGSGADQFRIIYIGSDSNENKKLVIPQLQLFADICDTLPGNEYNFTLVSIKSKKSSPPVSITHRIRPLPPKSIDLKPDFLQGKFKLTVKLVGSSESKADKCQIGILSDDAQRIDEVVDVNEVNVTRSCSSFFELVPGKRYDLSAAVISTKSLSKKIFKNSVLEPSFNLNDFNISVTENKGTLMFVWPTNPSSMAKLNGLWGKTVGGNSKLHVKVDYVSSKDVKENARQFDLNPFDGSEQIRVDHLRRGACYRVQMYTVTNTGIVSVDKYEEFLRLSPPIVDVKVSNVAKTTALIRITVTSFMEDPLHPVIGDLSDCSLNLVVLDESNMSVLEKRLNFGDLNAPSMPIDGLRPYHKYTMNSKVICGQKSNSSTVCSSKEAEMPVQHFETLQDIPGLVENFTSHVLNPYSVQLRWNPPSLTNGPLTHYLVYVIPTQQPHNNWTVSVMPKDSKTSSIDGVMNSLVVDGLVGGLGYTFDIQSVNEAGIGHSLPESSQPNVIMPILPPPKPSVRVEVVKESVHSTDLTVKFGTDTFSTKHGLLKKLSIIVAQIGADGRPNELSVMDLMGTPNKSFSWGNAQQFEFWPPYVALEVPLEAERQLMPQIFVQDIGIDSSCVEQLSDIVCNGPLKPGTGYRFKLRLYTAPNLWTDSLYSDVVITEPLRTSSAFRKLFTVLFVFISFGLLALLFLFIHSRRQRTPVKTSPSYSSSDSYGSSGRGFASKESQWAALKMIMAERAADCLAKLGLDSGNHAAPDGYAAKQQHNVIFSSTIPTPLGHTEVDAIKIISAPSPPTTQPPQLVKADSGSTLSASPTTFNAHHRRSRSLRERTGADQRLERLPSGPPPGAKLSSIPWTVMKGADTNKSRPIRIQDFAEHCRLMSADSDYLYSMEYEDFRYVGNGQTCIAAELPQNRSKNRFTNILPYDHSRVKLIQCDEDDGSDYINSSYIPGFNSRREFIAAQGPLPSTRDHFWKMVWEQGCTAIVALTKCVEKGRDKCHQYWPDINQRSVIYADIEVTLVNESIESNEYSIRELRLTHLTEFGHPHKTIHHFHYTAWPDFGAPEHPGGIVNFLRLFRSKVPPTLHSKPTIVHCSAGVGRSGTFIALDRLVQNIEIGRALDVFGVVHEMRMERCHMVQNEQQYIFIHQGLLFVLENYYPHLMIPSIPAWNNAVLPSFGLQSAVWSSVNEFQPHMTMSARTPRIEVHQNPAFMEDDEGIAESGL